MANIKYFSGTEELTRVWYMPKFEFFKKYPGITGLRVDGGWSRAVGFSAVMGREIPVDRMVDYKQFPTRHECDARCMNASGKIMRCECSCGGKNHGLGGAVSFRELLLEVIA